MSAKCLGLHTTPPATIDLRFRWKFIIIYNTKILDTVSLLYFDTIHSHLWLISYSGFIIVYWQMFDLIQRSTLSSSFWTLVCNVLIYLWNKCKLVSAAKSVVWKLVRSVRSFPQNKNSKGTIIEPWGTPQSIVWKFDEWNKPEPFPDSEILEMIRGILVACYT